MNPCRQGRAIEGLRLLALYCLVCMVGRANSSYRFDVWTADDGLPQNVIIGLAQAPDGYLWIATFNGLARFDGVRFTVFDRTTNPELSSNRITSLHADTRGDLWLHAGNGSLLVYRNHRFTAYTPRQGLPGTFINDMTIDRSGDILAVTASSIARWDVSKARFVPVGEKTVARTYHAMLWEGGGLWRVKEQDFVCYDGDGREFTYHLPAWLPSKSITQVAREQGGKIWLEASDGRQARIVDGEIQQVTKGKPGEENETIYRQRSGEVLRFDVGPHLVRSIKAVSLSNQLSKITFSSLLEDREGEIWLGNEGQGLFRLRRQFIQVYDKKQGLIDDNVYPIYRDHKGAVWIGAWQSGLSRYQDGKFTNYSVQDGLPTGLVTAISEDNEGRMWVAAHGGLRIFSGQRFIDPHGFLFPPHATLQAIHQDRRGVLWIGTTLGLMRSKSGDNVLLTSKDGLAGNDVRVLVEDASGDLWIGGYEGLTRLRNGQFTRWRVRDGLPSNTVRSVYVDDKGVVWIGTYDGGLGRLENGKITTYNVRSGLFDNGVFQILEDDIGNLWMSCNRGIYRVRKQQLNDVAAGRASSIVSVRYGRIDGMLNVECNGGLWPAGTKDGQGRLWFPTQEGVAVIDPSTVPVNTQPPPVVVESILLDGQSESLDKALKIPPGKENLEIHYAALSFVRSSQIRFRYKLEGLQSSWIEAGSRRTAYYAKIPPGQYLFRVIARNSDGIWNEDGQRVTIVALAPFYQTRWFELIIMSCAVGLVFVSWRYRSMQLKRAQASQQAFSSQLIASQEAERKRIAAELHDSLGQRLIMMKNLAQLSLKAQSQGRAEKAGDLIEQIVGEAGLAVEETRQISYDLRPYQLDRLGLTKAIEALIRKTSAASGLKCVANLDNVDDAFPDKLRINLYRIVQESLQNIVKHAQASEVEIDIVRQGQSHMVLTVRDDGCGIPPAVHMPDNKPGGFGLTGISERARVLGGEVSIQSKPGWGTVLTLEIKH